MGTADLLTTLNTPTPSEPPSHAFSWMGVRLLLGLSSQRHDLWRGTELAWCITSSTPTPSKANHIIGVACKGFS